MRQQSLRYYDKYNDGTCIYDDDGFSFLREQHNDRAMKIDERVREVGRLRANERQTLFSQQPTRNFGIYILHAVKCHVAPKPPTGQILDYRI